MSSDDFQKRDRDQDRVPNEGRRPSRGRSLIIFVILAVAIVGVSLFVSHRSSDTKNDPQQTAPTSRP